MSDTIQISMDDADRLYELPLVDHFSAESDSYAIEFVPRDDVSPEEKCFVVTDKNSTDGRRIGTLLARISELCAVGPIQRIIHAGGADYRLESTGSARNLHDLASEPAIEVSDRIHQIAEAAEYAYLVQGRLRSRSA